MIAQLRKLAASLTLRQRILIGVAALAVVAGLWWLNQWNRERAFQPLFARLSAEDAGAVVAKLKEGGVEYRLSANGATVLVPTARVAELRLQMAAAGVPKSGRIGYELFDKTNFGITDFAEQVNYRRAIEGELERSVLALSGVESARVHITPAKDSVFTESKEPAKASVLLTLKPDARLSPANVDAIAHLVSSAVQGLAPESVSVVDGSGKLIPGKAKQAQEPLETDAAEKALAFRMKIEKDLLDKLNGTLEPLLGAKRFRTGVSVECDFSSGEQSEEVFDPAKSAVSNTQKSDESGVALSNTPAGQPGTASNLPRPPARAAAGSQTPVARKTENTTYQNSRLVRKTKIPTGTVRRVSVAVLMDQNLNWEVENGKAKRVLTPPSAEQMKSIRDVVTGVAGADPKRGDTVVVESVAFESTLRQPPPPGLIPPPPPKPVTQQQTKQEEKPDGETMFGMPKQQLIMIAAIGGGALLLLLGGFVFLVLKRRRKKKAMKAEMAAALPVGPDGKQLPPGAKGQIEEPEEEEEPELVEARKKALEAKQAKEVLGAIKMPETTSKKAAVLTKHISDEAKKSPEAMAEYVRSWLNAQEDR